MAAALAVGTRCLVRGQPTASELDHGRHLQAVGQRRLPQIRPVARPVAGARRDADEVRAAARASLKGRFFFAFDEDYGDPAATGAAHAYCSILAHRYREPRRQGR